MTFLSSIVKTILLGIIQGITEWLPISSTGHLILFASIWPLEPTTFFEVFKVVIQFGSILAVLVLYYQKLNPFDTRKSPKKRKQTLQLWSKVIWASFLLPLLAYCWMILLRDIYRQTL